MNIDYKNNSGIILLGICIFTEYKTKMYTLIYITKDKVKTHLVSHTANNYYNTHLYAK